MKRPPRDLHKDRLLSNALLVYSYVIAGMINAGGCLAAYGTAFWRHGISFSDLFMSDDHHWKTDAQVFCTVDGECFEEAEQMYLLEQARGSWYIALIVCQFFHIWVAKTRCTSVFRTSLVQNTVMMFGTATELLIVVLVVYVPGLQSAFGTASVDYVPMELARWHFSAANGFLWQVIKSRRMILVGSQAIRYRHAISPFQAYEIKTQVVYWDNDWLYILHQFQDAATGKQFAEGLVRGVVMKEKRRVPAHELFAEVNPSSDDIIEAPTEMPDIVKAFLDWDQACAINMKEAGQKAEKQLKVSPLSPLPQKLGARMWHEMKKSMNLP
ncbi:unnamed protein product [Peronospora belbahrii]|uniref:Cation-transporting P-type ATPase C-terminal domain-containing protein n=1 Tax=Peronospora belbahrii TaxID=622444 RepID=A0AAU9KYS1_9STRA|nr:unnamed protein product [Peronospora belbahrii]